MCNGWHVDASYQTANGVFQIHDIILLLCSKLITTAVTHGVKYSVESLDFTPVIIVIKHLGYDAFSVPTPT